MEEFVDYTVVRPHVRPRDDGRREIRWPNHEFFGIRSETHAFDLVVGLGVEPHLRWRAFSAHVVELVRTVRARQVILLGAFLDEVIYSQPIQIVGSSSDAELSRVQAAPNSRAALALLQRVEAATGFPIDKAGLETAAANFDQEVSEAIAADPQLSAYVRELKRRAFSS
jgi:proteasome assembly chaperone (PAC2) family protein